jgi:hypothetical protein
LKLISVTVLSLLNTLVVAVNLFLGYQAYFEGNIPIFILDMAVAGGLSALTAWAIHWTEKKWEKTQEKLEAVLDEMNRERMK